MMTPNGASVDFIRFLVSLIIQKNFAHLHTVLIVIDSANTSPLQLGYLDGVAEGVGRLVQNNMIVCTWVDIADLTNDDFFEKVLANVEIGTQDVLAYICFLKGKVLEAMDSRSLAMDCYVQSLQRSVYCSEALDALVQHEMLMAWEEKDLMQHLPFNQQCTTAEGKLIRKLYESKLEKYYESVDPGYIIILSNSSTFIAAKYYASQHSNLRQRDKKILMLTENELPTSVLNNRLLFLYPMHVLLRPKIGSHVELWTQQYTGKHNNDMAKLLGNVSWNELNPEDKLSFPDKIKNLQGRHINVSSVTYLPYMFIKAVNDGTGVVDGIGTNSKNIFYEGTEADLVIEFCRLRNCTIKADLYEHDHWGTIYPNGSSEGLLGSLYTKKTEIGIGCLYNWFHRELDVSDVISKSSVTLLVPLPTRLPAYLAPFMPFSAKIWAIVVIMPIFSSIFYYFLQTIADKKHNRRMKRMFNESALQIISIFFQQSYVRDSFVTKPIRFYIVSLLLSSILLDVMYSSRLKSQMAVPQYTESIDMAFKFAQTNFKWHAPADAWVRTIRTSNIPFEQTLSSNFEIKSNTEMKVLTSSGKYGFAIERLNSGYYAFGKFLEPRAMDKLQILKDNIFYDYTRALAIRGWPLLPRFNQFILETSQTGLMIAWERQYVRKYLDSRTEEALLNSKINCRRLDGEPVTLNLMHVSGMFLLLLSGYMLSLCSFLCEIVTYHYKNKKRLETTIK